MFSDAGRAEIIGDGSDGEDEVIIADGMAANDFAAVIIEDGGDGDVLGLAVD